MKSPNSKSASNEKDHQLWETHTRTAKMVMLFLFDLFLVPCCLFLAFVIRLGADFTVQIYLDSIELSFIAVIVGIVAIVIFKPYRLRLETFDVEVIKRIAAVAISLTISTIVASYLLNLWAPRSVPLILGTLFFFSSLNARIVGSIAVGFLRNSNDKVVRVAVYGAGAAGIQLVSALRQSNQVKPIVFVDDNPALHSLIISGLKVRKPSVLKLMAEHEKIDRVLIAMPSMNRIRRNEILETLAELPCDVQIMPSYVDLIYSPNDDSEANYRTVSPDELLERDKVELDIPIVEQSFAGRTVMVTGAGGSIGSELCKQIIDCKPNKLILFEQSEFALYAIDQHIQALPETQNIEFVTSLGTVGDDALIRSILTEHKVEIVLHAAAYKHVPLLEDNAVQGVQNNVFGTKIIAEAASDIGIERFILVSTDKAVRPTNVMGATKRVAELIIQDIQARTNKTKFAMVRFGNVLGSSGSVIPLFKHQISIGGPVTVTHPEVTRFFMTIPEAARLVLLAGSYATGDDVFLLDMGQPVKIVDLAKRMISLSGRDYDETGENSDAIHIKFVGLRAGEKLYEELLLSGNSLTETPHPKIMRAKEEKLSEIEVARLLKRLKAAVDDYASNDIRSILSDYVSGYEYSTSTEGEQSAQSTTKTL